MPPKDAPRNTAGFAATNSTLGDTLQKSIQLLKHILRARDNGDDVDAEAQHARLAELSKKNDCVWDWTDEPSIRTMDKGHAAFLVSAADLFQLALDRDVPDLSEQIMAKYTKLLGDRQFDRPAVRPRFSPLDRSWAPSDDLKVLQDRLNDDGITAKNVMSVAEERAQRMAHQYAKDADERFESWTPTSVKAAKSVAAKRSKSKGKQPVRVSQPAVLLGIFLL